MLPEDTAILHPGSYSFRSYVAQLVTRAVAVPDAAQKAHLQGFLNALQTATQFGLAWQVPTWPSDGDGHGGRHLYWLSKELHYKASYNADVKTDLLAIVTAAIALL